jgi:thymidine phosphorylase
VLDVKCGDGAFMKDRAKAQALAESMVAIGTRAGVRTEAFLTDMDAPLGRTVGNALEIAECLDTLKGRGPDDLTAVVTRLAARMTLLAGLETTANAARSRAAGAVVGRALDVFARMVERRAATRRRGRLRPDAGGARIARRSRRGRDGVVTRVLAGSIGRAAHQLGAGRTTVGEPVDHAVGCACSSSAASACARAAASRTAPSRRPPASRPHGAVPRSHSHRRGGAGVPAGDAFWARCDERNTDRKWRRTLDAPRT